MTEDETIDGITDEYEFEQALGVSDGQGRVLQSMGSQRVRHD